MPGREGLLHYSTACTAVAAVDGIAHGMGTPALPAAVLQADHLPLDRFALVFGLHLLFAVGAVLLRAPAGWEEGERLALHRACGQVRRVGRTTCHVSPARAVAST